MNVLFLNNFPFYPSIGGIERVTDLLAKEFIDVYKYNVYYVVTENKHIDTLEYQLPAPLFVLPAGSLETKQQRLSEIVKKYGIDVIINQRGQISYFADLVQCLDIPIISVIHSQPNAYIKLHLNKILRHSDSIVGYVKFILKIILYPLLYLKRRRYIISEVSGLYRNIIERSDAVVLLSDKYIDGFNSLVKTKDNQHCKIMGIPNPNTYKIISTLPKKSYTLLYVGRLCSEEKNPIRLLKIWRVLSKKHIDWDLKFVGDGNALDSMKKYVVRYNLQRVNFCGNQENVMDYYLDASFVCLISNIEGWGMALTEGMQCGCIPITFNSYGAASDIIDDGINGCLIEPFNLREYARRLSDLMSDEHKRERMSEAAQKKVKQFDVSNVAKKWNELIQELLSKQIRRVNI